MSSADVGYMVRMMMMMKGGHKEDRAVTEPKSTVPITRDLLGGCCSSGTTTTLESTGLDLDLQVPQGWEKRLDLKSGKVYLHRRSSSPAGTAGSKISSSSSTSSSTSSSSDGCASPKRIMLRELDLLRPSIEQRPRNYLLDDESTNLDLQLVSSSSSSQSVCTLEKVKSALERAEKLETMIRKRSRSSSSKSNSEEERDWEEEEERSSWSSVAAGCPSCMMYVLIPKSNPKCPRCHSNILPSSLGPIKKKPRIDLNMSF